MRCCALQTDINALKKQFILESEEEILTTRHHPLVFFLPFVLATCVAVPSIFLLIATFPFFISQSLGLVNVWAIIIGLLCYACFIGKAFIDWRYNVLILTNQKIVLIEHVFLFYQHVSPIPLNNLASTMSESQLLGLWHCGILHLSLEERTGMGSTKEITLRYIPKAEVVAGAIDSAMALLSQKGNTETTQEQLPKVQEVQQKAEEGMSPAIPAQEKPLEATTGPSEISPERGGPS